NRLRFIFSAWIIEFARENVDLAALCRILAALRNRFDLPIAEPAEFRFQIIRRHRGSRLQRRVVRVDARRARHAPDLESTDRLLVNVERQNGDCYEEDDDGD